MINVTVSGDSTVFIIIVLSNSAYQRNQFLYIVQLCNISSAIILKAMNEWMVNGVGLLKLIISNHSTLTQYSSSSSSSVLLIGS